MQYRGFEINVTSIQNRTARTLQELESAGAVTFEKVGGTWKSEESALTILAKYYGLE